MSSYPAVALDFMNRDHAEFAALLQRLLELLRHKEDVAQIDDLLEQLLQHTQAHFAEEERQMQLVHFPPYPIHKGEHDNVLQALTQQVNRWKTARNTTALHDWLQHELNDWFVRHVSSMDFVTASFIAARNPA